METHLQKQELVGTTLNQPATQFAIDYGPIQEIIKPIRQIFSITEANEVLAAQARFGKFKPEWLSPQLWERLLGIDVNNASHMQLSTGLMRIFIGWHNTPDPAWLAAPQNTELTLIGQQEAKLLMIAAEVHDQHEHQPEVGDVPKPQKMAMGAAWHEHEMYHLRDHVALTYRADPSLLAEINFAVDATLADPGSRLGEFFELTEVIGYMRTAFHAFRHEQYLRTRPESDLQQFLGVNKNQLEDIFTSLANLSNSVVNTHWQFLIDKTSQSPAVARFIGNRRIHSIDQNLLQKIGIDATHRI